MGNIIFAKLKIVLICILFLIPLNVEPADKKDKETPIRSDNLELVKAIDAYSSKYNYKERMPNRFLKMVEKLPPKASYKEIKSQIELLLEEMGRITRGELNIFRESIKLLVRQPEIVRTLTNYYKLLPKISYYKRLRVLQLLGELQLEESLPFFTRIIWEASSETIPIPSPHLTSLNFESMLKSKAVQCIAFIRTKKGGYHKKAEKGIIRILKDHLSKLIRISAIDSYMWNHGDSRTAKKLLYRLLPMRLHKYIERPRFYKGANAELFQKRLNLWRKKWIKKNFES